MVIQLAFEIVEATCHQHIEIIDKNYDEESLIKGLNNGSLVTTTWHDSNMDKVIENVATGDTVAKVISQEIDGEYSNFR